MPIRTNPDGTRTPTRIADRYLKVLADWIKGQPEVGESTSELTPPDRSHN
jgi:hypothetical protein